MMRLASAATLATVLCLLGGCAGASRLSLVSVSNQRTFTHRFEQTCAGRSVDGDWQIVLVDPGRSQAGQRRVGDPLQPAPLPLKQVVYLRMFWRPMKGAKYDYPSASNAAVDWYVIGSGNGDQPDFLHYQGVGFVRLSRSSEGVSVTLDNATLQPVARRGGMEDPVGSARLSGKIHARLDPQRVRRELGELRQLRPDETAR